MRKNPPSTDHAEPVDATERLLDPTAAASVCFRPDAADGSLFPHECHPGCIACRDKKLGGLGLRFRRDGPAGVCGVFPCDPEYQGYPDRVHGGIIALALDAAMTHCLFGARAQAVTARLEVRYRRPVRLGDSLEIRAQIVTRRGVVYRLTAEARQGRTVCAVATATFVDLARTRNQQ